MKARTLTACAPALFVLFGVGCGAILGIPSDVERSGSDSGLDAPTPAEGGEDGSLPDARVDAEVDADAGKPDAPAPLCDSTKELGTPVLITTVSTPRLEGSPHLTEDELTMYFDGQRGAGADFDLFAATRTAITDSFGAYTSLGAGANTPTNHEFSPNVSTDGKTLFFERQDPLTNSDFYVATRPDLLSPFGSASPISGTNTPGYDGKLGVRGDGSELYFVKDVTAPASLDIHVAKRVAGNYVITKLLNVNSASDEYAPVISPNGLVLYFASTRPFAAGRTDENVWVATRASTADAFGAPTQVLNVNSLQDDEPSWISADGCRLYMISDRPGGAGLQDIYVATRPK